MLVVNGMDGNMASSYSAKPTHEVTSSKLFRPVIFCLALAAKVDAGCSQYSSYFTIAGEVCSYLRH